MKTFMIISMSTLLSVLGCTDNETDLIDRTYIIENDTEFVIDIKFYNKINNEQNIETSGVLNSKGDRILEEIEETDNLSEGLPASVFLADSVRVIINQDKFLTYTYNFDTETFSEPVNKNLFKHSNYESIGNQQYLYKITLVDYENAQPCNGNCE